MSVTPPNLRKNPSRRTTRTRPYTFIKKVSLDRKYLVDVEDHKHVAVSAVCPGTMYNVDCLVKNGVYQHVMQVFVDSLRRASAHECERLGSVERHGGLQRENWNKTVCEFQVAAREQAKLAPFRCAVLT